MRARMRCSAPALALFASIACAPSVKRFEAVPLHTCTGQVRLTWQTKGSLSLTADPPIADLPSPRGSSMDVRVTAPVTSFVLTARRFWPWSPRRGRQDVHFRAAGDVLVAAPTTSCGDGVVAAEATLPSDEWDDLLGVGAVTNAMPGRRVEIEHAGKSVTVGPGTEPDRGLAGTQVKGRWILRSPLLPGERCGDADAPPPATLSIVVTTACREEAAR
jgi:hypothetical protein